MTQGCKSEFKEGLRGQKVPDVSIIRSSFSHSQKVRPRCFKDPV